MDPLILRIRELDPRRFELLCFQLMSEKYPNASVRHVEGSSGDEGVDIFAGSLNDEPIIWQCKAFDLSRIGKSQREQIKGSLKRAVESHKPKYWTLCTNIEIDIQGRRWFERLQNSYLAEFGVILDLLQASDLMRDLLYYHTIRDYYFPNLALDVAEIRRIVSKTEGLSYPELSTLTQENAREMLDHLEKRDPRLSYEVTFLGNRGPGAFPPPAQPGLMASMSNGNMIINAFARDQKALRLDPYHAKIEISPEAHDRVRELIETGKEQEFRGKEIAGFDTAFPLLAELKIDPSSALLRISPKVDSSPIPLRVSLRSSTQSITYEYLEFKRLRLGSKEMEIATGDTSAAFNFRFVLPVPPETGGTASFQYKGLLNQNLRTVKKVVDTLQILGEGCDVELYSHKVESKLGVLKVHPAGEQISPWLVRLVQDLLAIAENFNVDLMLPNQDQLTDGSIDTLRMLSALATGGSVPLSNLAINLIKDAHNAEVFPGYLSAPTAMRLEHEYMKATLFGHQINTGPFALQVDQLEFREPKKSLQRFRRAKIGEVVRLRVKPLVPVKLELLKRAGRLEEERPSTPAEISV